MVSIDNFNKLSLDEKAWHIWNGATFLMVRTDENYRYNLFYMNDYYAELLYNVETNQIDKIRAFFTNQFLSDYLDSINLADLL